MNGMSAVIERSELFELELDLPNALLEKRANRLIGFLDRYERIRRDLALMASPDELQRWSQKHYGKLLPACDVITDRYPLVVFAGDVGTGKTVAAESISDRLTRDLKKPAMLFKLSTRVRGSGKVGQMSSLINQAFDTVVKEAGKAKLSFLIIDEADSLTASRDNQQSHHEDKVAVNTIIQKIDDLRQLGGRCLVFLCTNRFSTLDPAVLRRAARIEQFNRPNDNEREQLIRMDCEGLGISDSAISELVRLTGPSENPFKIGFTYSDLRSRWLPEALAQAFPSRKLTIDDLIEAAQQIKPSPAIIGESL